MTVIRCLFSRVGTEIFALINSSHAPTIYPPPSPASRQIALTFPDLIYFHPPSQELTFIPNVITRLARSLATDRLMNLSIY